MNQTNQTADALVSTKEGLSSDVGPIAEHLGLVKVVCQLPKSTLLGLSSRLVALLSLVSSGKWDLHSVRLQKLRQAVAQGDLDTVRMLYRAGCDLNVADSETGDSLLHVAIRHNQLEVLSVLVGAAHIDVNSQDAQGRSPLSCAVEQGKIEFAAVLLNAGASAAVRNVMGDTLLEYAVKEGNAQMVAALLQSDASGEVYNADWEALLGVLAREGKLELVQVLIDCGILFELRSMQQESLLHLAARANREDLAACLLQGGCDPDAVDCWGQTALHVAVILGNDGIARLLMEGGANLNLVVPDGRNALHIAVEQGRRRIAKWLIDAPAMNLNAQDELGETVLHKVVRSAEDFSMVLSLLKSQGLDPGLSNVSGGRAWEEMLPAPLGRVDLLRLFADWGPQAFTEADIQIDDSAVPSPSSIRSLLLAAIGSNSLRQDVDLSVCFPNEVLTKDFLEQVHVRREVVFSEVIENTPYYKALIAYDPRLSSFSGGEGAGLLVQGFYNTARARGIPDMDAFMYPDHPKERRPALVEKRVLNLAQKLADKTR